MNYHARKKRGKSLAWSNTRITLLEYCERKYYFNYYTFAMRDSYPELWQESLVLKGLKSIEMWVGEKSHYLLSDYLHLLKRFQNEWIANPSFRDEQVQEIKDAMKSEMKSEFAFSKERNYQDYDDFYGKFGLSEHFYEQDVDDQLLESIDKVLGNLDRFMESSWNSKVQDYFNSARFVYVEKPRIPNFEAMTVDVSKLPWLEHISVLASPDFGVTFSDTEYLILDWKSGKEDFLSEGISDQLKIYALKMLLKKGIHSLDGMKIEAYEVYLNSMHSYGGVITQQDIDTIIEKIGKDVDYQKQFLEDQDPIKNQPLDPVVFRKTTNLKKCESCTFRNVCGKLA